MPWRVLWASSIEKVSPIANKAACCTISRRGVDACGCFTASFCGCASTLASGASGRTLATTELGRLCATQEHVRVSSRTRTRIATRLSGDVALYTGRTPSSEASHCTRLRRILQRQYGRDSLPKGTGAKFRCERDSFSNATASFWTPRRISRASTAAKPNCRPSRWRGVSA
jgi:hypothetical protein